jgi:hypothetical protein
VIDEEIQLLMARNAPMLAKCLHGRQGA